MPEKAVFSCVPFCLRSLWLFVNGFPSQGHPESFGFKLKNLRVQNGGLRTSADASNQDLSKSGDITDILACKVPHTSCCKNFRTAEIFKLI